MKLARHILSAIVDWLSPEDAKVERLLQMEPSELWRRLPKPRSIEAPYAQALFDYRDDKVRTLIKAIKYKGNLGVIKRMAGFLYEEIIEFTSEISSFNAGGKIIIAPMPMSHSKKVARGWSQCELLCKEVEKLCGGGLFVRFDILKKIKDTKKQTDLRREERLSNVKGSMEAGSILPKNSTIIVVDDVYTTGATFSEAKRALLVAGAKRVAGFFVAH
jgi:ComF family protein